MNVGITNFKSKVKDPALGWGSQPQRRAAFNRVWENIFMNSDRYECWNYKFQKQRGVFDKDVERGRQRGVFDKDVERWGWLPHPKFIGSQPQSSLPHTLFILPKLDFHQASHSGTRWHMRGSPWWPPHWTTCVCKHLFPYPLLQAISTELKQPLSGKCFLVVSHQDLKGFNVPRSCLWLFISVCTPS